jgi:hypothetical protein
MNRKQYAKRKEAQKKKDRDPQEKKEVAQGPSQEEETLIVQAPDPDMPGQCESIALVSNNRSCNDFSL